MISKQEEIFNKLADERIEEITKLDKKVDPDDVIYVHKGPTVAEAKFDNAFNLLNKIRKSKISIADPKNDQIVFKSNLGELIVR